jgi:hypothetical protein
VEGTKFKAEVRKDRTGTFALGAVIENPRIEMWAKAIPAMPTPEQVAAELVTSIGAIATAEDAAEWKKAHGAEMDRLRRVSPVAHAQVLAAAAAKKKALTEEPSDAPPPEEVAA